jgi:hypothetical protein
LDAESQVKWSKDSSLAELQRLQALDTKGEIYLDRIEQKALQNWIAAQKYKEPIRVELEPGDHPVTFDKNDSKENLSYVAEQYAKGEHWATKNLTREDYKKLKSWIADKDKNENRDGTSGQKAKDERVKVGDRFVSKQMDINVLQDARTELAKSNVDKLALEKLDGWIDFKEREEGREGRGGYKPKRKKTAREKLMERAVRIDRTERMSNYYKEKAHQRERLQSQRQKFETTYGRYSEIVKAEFAELASAEPGSQQFKQLLKDGCSKLKHEREQVGSQAKNSQKQLADTLKDQTQVSNSDKALAQKEFERPPEFELRPIKLIKGAGLPPLGKPNREKDGRKAQQAGVQKDPKRPENEESEEKEKKDESKSKKPESKKDVEEKTKEDPERKSKEDAEKKTKEDPERKSKEDAEKKTKENPERESKKEVEKTTKREPERESRREEKTRHTPFERDNPWE